MTLLVLAEVFAMSLWFVSSAILVDLQRQVALSGFQSAMLVSSVAVGFVVGALYVAMSGIADRYDPRKVFAASAVLAALANTLMLIAEPGGALSVMLRILTGFALAGVYPVGMKIAVGWGLRDRGWLIGLLVGGLTLGSAFAVVSRRCQLEADNRACQFSCNTGSGSGDVYSTGTTPCSLG